MSKLAWTLMLATLTIGPSALAQTAIPDLRGTWRGDSESIVTGGGNLEASVRSASRPRGQAHRRTSLQAGLNGGAGRSGAMGIVAWRSGRDRLGRGFEEPWGGRDGEGHLGGSSDAYGG